MNSPRARGGADPRAPGQLTQGLVTEALYPKLSRKHGDFPIRTIYFDGSPASLERDLELFLELARRYRVWRPQMFSWHGRAVIKIKRVYEPPSPGDGRGVLVDRLWPRGLSREKGKIDEWAKEIAPSDQLRRWFGHDPKKWAEFHTRYREELLRQKTLPEALAKRAKRETMTLLFAKRDLKHNNAIVLKEFLEELSSPR